METKEQPFTKNVIIMLQNEQRWYTPFPIPPEYIIN